MLKLSLHYKQSGFSLVELMVGIAIMAILVTLGMPSYNAWIHNTRVRTGAESIQNGLQLARAEAVKHNTKVEFELDANSGWTVGCVVPVEPDCPSVIQQRTASDGSSTDVTVVTIPADSDTVVFNNLGTVSTDATDPVPFTQVDLSSATLSVADSRPLRVTIGVGGNTRMCDPSTTLAASDPRKC
ncbi:fimbrial protein precursor [mine drainage metagenome]|uniref:Fimbrial protein n=1 Tax=mine drainage metagenome TaxID=410659 RepID=A0A1J5STK5_9ZZZZ